MERIRKEKIRMISNADSQEFEREVNEAVDMHPDGKLGEIQFSDGKFWVVLRYEEITEVKESVKDEFNLEGFRFICRECPHHEPVTDGRVKWCHCKYSESGIAHLEHECCEFFYKQLKQNNVEVQR